MNTARTAIYSVHVIQESADHRGPLWKPGNMGGMIGRKGRRISRQQENGMGKPGDIR
jgi:hypothetical protein